MRVAIAMSLETAPKSTFKKTNNTLNKTAAKRKETQENRKAQLKKSLAIYGGGGPTPRTGWWYINRIVAELGPQYLVEWTGKDPETGDKYPNEWVS